MKTLLLFGALALSINSFAQNVTIPDATFKAYLVGNIAINTNTDTEIQVSEAVAFGGTIDCSSLSVSDLTGIEAFTALTFLNCSYNQLTSLDLSQNTALTYFDCSYNQLNCLNLANGNNLSFDDCYVHNNPNLICIEVDDSGYMTNNWNTHINIIDPQTSFSNDCNNGCSTVGMEELSNSPKQLLKIVDLVGRETPYKPNTALIYVYSDGTTERVFKMKD